MVPDQRHGAQHLRGAPPAVLPVFVGPVPLGVVAGESTVVLFDQILPASGLEEVVVGHPLLDVERRLDEALPGLASLDLLLGYAQGAVDGLRPIGLEDASPAS